MKKNFKEKLISGWKEFIKEPIFHILVAIIFVSVYVLVFCTFATIFFGSFWDLSDLIYLVGILNGAIFLLYVYTHLKDFFQSLRDPKTKAKTNFELYIGIDESTRQAICLYWIFVCPLFFYGAKYGLGEKLGGYFWLLLSGWFIVSFIIVAFVRWIGSLIVRRVEAKRECTAEPSNSSENRPPQHIEKSSPWKDQDDQVMITKGKKEKSLYQRLRELPLSKDRVGQSFIIVRGGQVVKPGNGDGGGDEKDG